MTILIVDNDGKSLAALQRLARKRIDVHIALSAKLALQRMTEDGPYAVVIVEQFMPEMDGVALLREVRSRWPNTVRVLMSRAPLESPIFLQAINDTKVYHVIPNPCPEAVLNAMLDEALLRYDRNAALSMELRQQHALFAKVIHEIVCWLRIDVREMISPVLPVLRALSARLGDGTPMLTETALLSSVIGMICMPQSTLEKVIQGAPLSAEECVHFANHPIHALELFRHLPALHGLVELLQDYATLLQHCSGSATEASCTLSTERASTGALLLALIMEYRLAVYRKLDLAEILRVLAASPLHYPPEFLRALEEEAVLLARVPEELPLDALKPGMVVARAVLGERDGAEVVLVPEGYELSRTTIVFLRQSARHGRVHEPIAVLKAVH